ncbi:FAD-dependent oxidoreductase [Ignavigranum ruoffiae]|uniref:FAD-dependent oxidoreductase n=1 Tax=Ignavigranum ruoffiae TaxID=89093 RepID=UPI0020702DD9|nr:FAD-dependent oxidoreductase [Ignavigranum ruoffiae]UPQ86098.1 FAD-dependent oxidoreductase [Ignavigranum ruoffiae]
MKVIVVGTSHAGYEAVQTILKDAPDTEIHLYERGTTASFLSCGIQSFLEDISPSLDSLHYANEESYKKQGVNIHMNSDVVAVDPAKKTITVKTEQGEETESYDKLFLSPGAVPVEIPVPGLDAEGVYYMRGRDWAGKIKERMNTAKKAVVVGGGYIGIEVAEAFTKHGIDTTIIDFQPTILPTYLDKEFTDILIKNCEEHGMKFHGGEGVKEIVADNGKVSKVVTDKGEYECDTVVMAVGVKPNTAWLKDTLAMNEKGFVEVNEYLESSEKDIYVAGDATFIPFAPDHGKRPIALASNARRQAVIAAKNLLHGNKMEMVEVSGTSGLALFDYHFACTGVKDVDAKTIGKEVDSKYYEEQILPDFIQNPETVHMKIHFEKDSHRIVGAQLMSKEPSVIMSINAISVAISAGWTLEQLALADFFFQPEYDRPWNFLNVLAQQAIGDEFTFGSDKEIF